MQSVHAIVLAAGKGTRMKSELPKVLNSLQGTTLLSHVLHTLAPLSLPMTVVVGYEAGLVRADVGDKAVCVLQEQQLGTGHAVACAVDTFSLPLPETTLVLLGDMPLVTTESVRAIIDAHQQTGATVTVGTVVPPSFEDRYQAFRSYGRVVRDAAGRLARIVEVKDASEDERAIHELNTGIYCFDTVWLKSNINTLAATNKAGEYYLTDMVAFACEQRKLTATVTLREPSEALGANTPEELEQLAALMRTTI